MTVSRFLLLLGAFASCCASFPVEAATCGGNLHLSGRINFGEPLCTEEALHLQVQRQLCCGNGCGTAPMLNPSAGPPSSCTDSPMRGGRVELWIDGNLAFATLTDDLGEFSFCLNNGNPSASGTFQIFFLPCADGEDTGDACGSLGFGTPQAWSVTLTDDTGTFYVDASAAEPGVCTGAIRWDVYDRRSTQGSAKSIFDLLAKEAQDALLLLAGWENTFKLPVRYPSAQSGFSTASRSMHVAPGDEHDEDVILRAYSYFVLYELYGESFPPVGASCASSDWGVETDPTCAWINGAARFLQSAIQLDAVYEDSPAPGAPPTVVLDLENVIPATVPPNDEGAVAAVLWDMFDEANEPNDPLEESLLLMLQTIENHHPKNICEFVDAYQKDVGGPIPELDPLLVSHSIGCPRIFGVTFGEHDGSLRADKDAQNVFDALSALPGWAPASIFNTSGPENTLLNWKIRLASMQVRPGDILVFYYSGHGGSVDNMGAKSSASDETPVDVTIRDGLIKLTEAANTGDEAIATKDGVLINDDELAEYFRDRSEKWEDVLKVFIFDACYAGGFEGDSLTADTGDLETLGSNYVLISAAPETDGAYIVGGALTNQTIGGVLFESGTGVWTNLLLPHLDLESSFAQLDSIMTGASALLAPYNLLVIPIKAFTETGDEGQLDIADWNPTFAAAANVDPGAPLLAREPRLLPEPDPVLGLVAGVLLLGWLARRRDRGRGPWELQASKRGWP